MVDPKFVTNYDRNDTDLEEFACFSICVAGKNAKVIAKAVNKLKTELCFRLHNRYYERFHILLGMRAYISFGGTKDDLIQLMSSCGIGCASNRLPPCLDLADRLFRNTNYLRLCTVEDLESIWGIGSKTARFFLLHSRPNIQVAALDVHILTFLRDCGIKAPKSTPPKGSTQYKQLELKFLAIADLLKEDPADLDLFIWNHYSKNGLNYDADPRTISEYIERVKLTNI